MEISRKLKSAKTKKMQNARIVILVGYFALIDKRIGRLRCTWLVRSDGYVAVTAKQGDWNSIATYTNRLAAQS
jgi:hypothetical protein